MKSPVKFGKYYLLERINVGGMAEIDRAVHAQNLPRNSDSSNGGDNVRDGQPQRAGILPLALIAESSRPRRSTRLIDAIHTTHPPNDRIRLTHKHSNRALRTTYLPPDNDRYGAIGGTRRKPLRLTRNAKSLLNFWAARSYTPLTAFGAYALASPVPRRIKSARPDNARQNIDRRGWKSFARRPGTTRHTSVARSARNYARSLTASLHAVQRRRTARRFRCATILTELAASLRQAIEPRSAAASHALE